MSTEVELVVSCSAGVNIGELVQDEEDNDHIVHWSLTSLPRTNVHLWMSLIWSCLVWKYSGAGVNIGELVQD